jgi:hypothetical protein
MLFFAERIRSGGGFFGTEAGWNVDAPINEKILKIVAEPEGAA